MWHDVTEIKNLQEFPVQRKRTLISISAKNIQTLCVGIICFFFYRQGLKISNFAGIISSQWENAPPDQEMTLDSETKRQNKFSRQTAFDWLTWSLISDQNTSFESFRCVYRNATQNMRK